jgi:hypothetical protein
MSVVVFCNEAATTSCRERRATIRRSVSSGFDEAVGGPDVDDDSMFNCEIETETECRSMSQ